MESIKQYAEKSCSVLAITGRPRQMNVALSNEPRHKKADFCLCENKDSTLSLLIKSEISSFYAASGTVHVGLCQTWSETPKTGFLASRLKY